MGAKRKVFDAAFKRAAVRRAESGDATVLEVARELGIRSDRLREWIAQARGTVRDRGTRQAPEALPAPPRRLIDEVRELRRENARLQEERDILKKAAAFFARESQ